MTATAHPVGEPTSDRPSVTFRRMAFSFDADAVPRHWYADSAALTHFFNALTAVFPDGERYFIDSVRAYQSRISDPRLQAEVREFVRQEGHHSYHHRRFNQALQDMGVSIDECEAIAKRILDDSRANDSPMMQLAMTAAFEHLTALMCDWLLRRDQTVGSDAHPSVAPLWLWHAAEETEHKAVAFDVYRAVGGSYWMRAFAMVRVTQIFLPRIHQMQLLLLREDPEPVRVADVIGALRYLYGPGGYLTSLLSGYFRYYKPRFHPWDDDNSGLLARWQAQQSG